jgi:hypothetical protein
MRCYNQPHRFYCGVDLHARSLYAHVLDARGQTVLDKDLPASTAAFLGAVAPLPATATDRDRLLRLDLARRAAAHARPHHAWIGPRAGDRIVNSWRGPTDAARRPSADELSRRGSPAVVPDSWRSRILRSSSAERRSPHGCRARRFE